MFAVRLPVANEPDVPVPPKPFEEEHAVLLVDDHVTTALEPFVVIAGVAEALTIGGVLGILEEELPTGALPPPHETTLEAATNTEHITPSEIVELMLAPDIESGPHPSGAPHTRQYAKRSSTRC